MYYLYKKAKGNELPEFSYIFKKFSEFYEVATVLERPLVGSYYIQIKSDSYDDVMRFISIADHYNNLVVYIELSDSLLEYITLHKPGVSLLESKSNFLVFKELISRYGILFDKGCIEAMYFAIDHSYSEMNEALALLQSTFPNVNMITKKELSELFVLDNLIYPRSVLIAYLRMDRGREYKLKKCIEHFGNDLVMYSMRKSVRKFLDEKIKYLKTGQGSKLIKMIPQDNIVKMCNCLDYSRGRFKDITVLMELYEKGETVNDTLQKRTYSIADEEHYAFR